VTDAFARELVSHLSELLDAVTNLIYCRILGSKDYHWQQPAGQPMGISRRDGHHFMDTVALAA
jgi:hypothetical protein